MASGQIVGLMSGTSLDGLDIVLSSFESTNEKWTYTLHASKTYKYSTDIKTQLSKSKEMTASQLAQLDKKLGVEMAKLVNRFIKEFQIDRTQIQAIASHGHTVYHQPTKGFSLQIGCGSSLAYHTQLPVINDFRNKDIIAGGQGAPLVPIGDKYLFSDRADAFLNLGGFCNISFKKRSKWQAFDIGPCNLPLNLLASQCNKSYDAGGKMARKGELSLYLLDLLNSLPYYSQPAPKSLGTEWLEEEFLPMIKFTKSPNDNLRTVTEHIALQIAGVLNTHQLRSVLVTGGGAYNEYLLQRIRTHSNTELFLPNKETIEFKEALIFAFMGVLHLEKQATTLPTLTGAKSATVGGVYHLPN